MEYQKDLEKLSFGFGSLKTAGNGNLSNAEEVPAEIKTKHNKKEIAATAAKAAALTGLILLRHKIKNKKRK